MTPTQVIEQYFRATGTSNKVGAEVETSFVTNGSEPISAACSQQIFNRLLAAGWCATQTKQNGAFVTEITSPTGDRLSYELGHQNFELATRPEDPTKLIASVRSSLGSLYVAAAKHDALPYFEPMLDCSEDTLAIPDERDATWLQLDGREALRPLGLISSVQFTIPVTVETSIPVLNRLGSRIGDFLANYPQDQVWRRYVADSQAEYRADRYGGPLQFYSLTDYCEKLCQHQMVSGSRLVPIQFGGKSEIDLFLRSIWWYFRLRRHGDQLCIEVRPLPRLGDDQLERQLKMVLDIAYG